MALQNKKREADRSGEGGRVIGPVSSKNAASLEKVSNQQKKNFRTMIDRLPGPHAFAIARAVSIIRQEKPHSLSYQERTRTNRPSVTLV